MINITPHFSSLSVSRLDALISLLCDSFVNEFNALNNVVDYQQQADALNEAFNVFGFESVAEVRMEEIVIHSGMSVYAQNFYDQLKKCAESYLSFREKVHAFSGFVKDVGFAASNPTACEPDLAFGASLNRGYSRIMLPQINMPFYEREIPQISAQITVPSNCDELIQLNTSVHALNERLTKTVLYPEQMVNAFNDVIYIMGLDARVLSFTPQQDGSASVNVDGHQSQFALNFIREVYSLYASDCTPEQKLNHLDLFVRDVVYDRRYQSMDYDQSIKSGCALK